MNTTPKVTGNGTRSAIGDGKIFPACYWTP